LELLLGESILGNVAQDDRVKRRQLGDRRGKTPYAIYGGVFGNSQQLAAPRRRDQYDTLDIFVFDQRLFEVSVGTTQLKAISDADLRQPLTTPFDVKHANLRAINRDLGVDLVVALGHLVGQRRNRHPQAARRNLTPKRQTDGLES